MKTKVYFVVALISIFFSCESSTSKNSKKENNKKIEVVADSMLIKISVITNPEEAKRIWMSSDGSGKVAMAAYTKYEKLMLIKISNITEADTALDVWLDNNYSRVGDVAFAKWEQLFRKGKK